MRYKSEGGLMGEFHHVKFLPSGGVGGPGRTPRPG